MSRKAAVLNARQLATFEEWVKNHSLNPTRDRVIIELTFRAGLRIGEVAKLEWRDVLDAEGEVNTDFIYTPSQIVKFQKRDRTIPMHPNVRAALVAQRLKFPDNKFVVNPIYKQSQEKQVSTTALTTYVWRLYDKAGFSKASSHSGRRTFITNLSRKANVHGCSLKDVQLLAGHSDIRTTEAYIEPRDNVSGLVLGEL